MPINPPPPLKSSLFGTRGPAAGGQKPKGSAAPKGPAGFRIEHRVGIQAPAEVIWDVLYDLSRWSEWNPLYPQASGEIRIGGTLTLTLALPGQPQQTIQPVVMEWVPADQLHWRLTMMGGLVKTVRFIEIEQLAEASCIVSNGEIFGGFMGPSTAKRIGRSIHRGFRDMNEALKTRAEGQWQARQ